MRCPWVTPRDRKPQPGQCLGPCPPFTATHSRTQGLVAGGGGLPAPPARGDPALRAVLVSQAAPCPPGEAGALEPSALVPPRPTDTWWLSSAGTRVPGTAERGDGTRPAATRVPGAWHLPCPPSSLSHRCALYVTRGERLGSCSRHRGWRCSVTSLTPSVGEAGHLTPAFVPQCDFHLGLCPRPPSTSAGSSHWSHDLRSLVPVPQFPHL